LDPYQYDVFLKYIVSGSRIWWGDTRQNVYTLKGDLTWQPLANHLVKMGVTLNQYDTFSDVVKYEPQTTYFGKPIPDAPMLNYSNTYDYWPRSGCVYIQDKIQIVEDGSNASFGLRWDFLDPTVERPIVEYIPTTPTEYTRQIMGKAKSSLKQQFSPRISLAIPVNPQTFLFFNIGYYIQFPLFDYLYSGLNPVQLRQGTKNVLAGNPDLEPERSSLWEAGLKQTLQGDAVLSVTCFAKQMTNQIDAKTLVPFNSRYAGDYGFASYVNNASANAYGLEIVLGRERNERLAGSISYTYMVTDALSEYADQNINIAEWGFKLAPLSYPLSWDQRHSVKGDFDFKVFDQIQSNIVILYNSPRPYTYFPTRDGYTPLDTSKLLVPNNGRMEDFFTINWKVSTSFKLSGLNGITATLYADIRNLLNRKNIKWMDSNGRVGGELRDPGAYYDPRRVKVGLRVDM
jgi:outer membrane receptor protein involved in Fe transport